jgi:hypothetical protein
VAAEAVATRRLRHRLCLAGTTTISVSRGVSDLTLQFAIGTAADGNGWRRPASAAANAGQKRCCCRWRWWRWWWWQCADCATAHAGRVTHARAAGNHVHVRVCISMCVVSVANAKLAIERQSALSFASTGIM